MEEGLLTPLYEWHVAHGGKMVPFAGYSLPVQYKSGVMQEHLHTRSAAGLFDVSHMGQVRLRGASWEAVALALERLVPQDVLGLQEGRQRYGFFTNEAGGIEDDLMIARRGDDAYVVVNAACKAADLARMQDHLEPEVSVELIEDRALIALQGPGAEAALATLNPSCADLRFMDVAGMTLVGAEAWVSRSGYTGEDGFEISVPEDAATPLWDALTALSDVEPIGLGARDSLRLEAGLCLYGQDIDATTTPLEAGLGWAIQKARKEGGARAGGYPGADKIIAPSRRRVGLRPDGRAPMRTGVVLYAEPEGGAPIGAITSGGFGPSVAGPVAMGYVPEHLARAGTALWGELRGRRMSVHVTDLPFVPANFKR